MSPIVRVVVVGDDPFPSVGVVCSCLLVCGGGLGLVEALSPGLVWCGWWWSWVLVAVVVVEGVPD